MEARVIALSIKSLEQQTKSVSLPRNASVLDLKAKIQTKFDIDGTRQRLIFQGKVLKDDKHLSDYDNLDDGKVVHLVVRPTGVPHNPDNDEPSRNWTSNGSSSRRSTRLSEGYAVITLDANLTDLPEGHSLRSRLMNLLPSLSSPPQTRPVTRLASVLRGGGTDGSHGSLRDYFRQGRRPGLDGLLDVMSARTSPISLPVPSSVEMRLSRTLSYIREIRSLLETPITDSDSNRPNQIRHTSYRVIRESRETLRSVGNNNRAGQVALVLDELATLTTEISPWLRNMGQSLRTNGNGRTSSQHLAQVLRTARVVQILSLIHHFLGSVLSTVETEENTQTTNTTSRDTRPETWSAFVHRPSSTDSAAAAASSTTVPAPPTTTTSSSSPSSSASSSSSSNPFQTKRKSDDDNQNSSSSSKKTKE